MPSTIRYISTRSIVMNRPAQRACSEALIWRGERGVGRDWGRKWRPKGSGVVWYPCAVPLVPRVVPLVPRVVPRVYL